MSQIETRPDQSLIGDPMLPQGDLTPQEATILWAHKAFDEYQVLPQNNHKQRAKAERFVGGVAQEIILDPEKLGIAAAVWRTREEEVPEGKKTFYSTVSDSASKLAEEEWHELSEKLSGHVRTLAHNELASPMVREVLKGYFNGPVSGSDRVDAYYNFVDAALDLLEDQDALKHAVEIGNYRTDILPADSDFRLELGILIDTTVTNDYLLGKIFTADHIMRSALTHLAPLDEKSDAQKEADQHFLQLLKSDKYKRRLREYIREQEEKIGPVALDKAKILGDANIDLLDGLIVRSSEAEFQILATWPYTATVLAKNSLRQKYKEQLEPIVSAMATRAAVLKEFGKSGESHPFAFSLTLDNGLILDICVGDVSLHDQKSNVVNYVLKRNPLNSDDIEYIKNHPAFGIIRGSESLRGQRIEYWYRKPASQESRRHPILALDTIGFPLSTLSDASKTSEVLRHEIKDNQIRYLNRRGVRVIFKAEELRKLGYSYIDFYRDDGKTRVEISVNGLTYRFILDANYNLDFEGKVFDSPLLGDFLRHITLSILRPILCDERLTGEKEDEIGQEEREVVTRMGHLRWLPLGQKYTKEAEENYLKIEGGDLGVKNLERKLDAERRHDPRSSQYTTYVRPVKEPEENLPPLVLNLAPGVVKFK